MLSPGRFNLNLITIKPMRFNFITDSFRKGFDYFNLFISGRAWSPEITNICRLVSSYDAPDGLQ